MSRGPSVDNQRSLDQVSQDGCFRQGQRRAASTAKACSRARRSVATVTPLTKGTARTCPTAARHARGHGSGHRQSLRGNCLWTLLFFNSVCVSLTDIRQRSF